MKAYVLKDIGKFAIEDVKEPVPAEDEVLVRVKAAGICGSDIPRIFYNGTYSYPLIPGHEYSGVVVPPSAINGAENPHDGRISEWLGKRVGVFPLIPCGKCIPCQQKKYEMCRHYSYLGSRRDGGFAEYVSVPVWNLIELPEQVTFEQAAMMEPMAVAVHAMRKTLKNILNKDLRIAICGMGTIGLFLLMFLKEAGYEDIIVIGKKEIQRKKALLFGVPENRYYDISDGGADRWLEEQSAEKGIDVFFECVGSNDSVKLAVSHTDPGGTVMLVGNPASDMTLDRQAYWKILRNQLTLLGTWNSSYDHDKEDDWHYVLNRLASGSVHPEELITHRFGFDDLMEGFTVMRDKTEDYLKVMMTN